jgi:Uma2 family endonuclease
VSVSDAVVDGRLVTVEQYRALGEDPAVEYIDGRLAVSPSPSRRHQKACTRLVAGLELVLPATHDVAMAWAWTTGTDEFIPDVMVHEATTESTRFTGTPTLLIEVLSGNRRDDLVLKRRKYAVAGVPHYWVVDVDAGTVEALEADPDDAGSYRVAQLLDADTGARALDFGVASLIVDPRRLA